MQDAAPDWTEDELGLVSEHVEEAHAFTLATIANRAAGEDSGNEAE